jgi:hypothetical protein
VSGPRQRKTATKRSRMSIVAAVIGLVSLVMISATFFVPWYEAHRSWMSSHTHLDEFALLDYTRDGHNMSYHQEALDVSLVGNLMSDLTLLVALSVAASSIAFVLTVLNKRRSGAIAGVTAAAITLVAGCYFYFGIIDALDLDGFIGTTFWSKSASVEVEPMLGYLITIVAPIVQSAQAVVLVYSGDE